MATMWALVEMCFSDARRAEGLIRDTRQRKALRLDPDAALAGFALWRGEQPKRDARRVEPRRSRAMGTPAVVRVVR